MQFTKRERKQVPTAFPEANSNPAVDPKKPSPLPSDIDDDTIVKTYLSLLNDHGITETHILRVLDALLTEGVVNWSFDLLEKIPCMFTTRNGIAVDFLMECLEEEDPKMVSRYQSIVAHVNISASLVRYKEHTFAVDTKESIRANMDWLAKQPFIIIDSLTKQLALFDRVIAVATSEWGIKNFTQPLSES